MLMGKAMPKMCDEMVKLRGWLSEHGIDYLDASITYDERFYCHRTKFVIGWNEFSVINGVGTYGGSVDVGFRNMGLLEMRVNGEEPVGCLRSDEVSDRVKRYLK